MFSSLRTTRMTSNSESSPNQGKSHSWKASAKRPTPTRPNASLSTMRWRSPRASTSWPLRPRSAARAAATAAAPPPANGYGIAPGRRRCIGAGPGGLTGWSWEPWCCLMKRSIVSTGTWKLRFVSRAFQKARSASSLTFNSGTPRQGDSSSRTKRQKSSKVISAPTRKSGRSSEKICCQFPRSPFTSVLAMSSSSTMWQIMCRVDFGQPSTLNLQRQPRQSAALTKPSQSSSARAQRCWRSSRLTRARAIADSRAPGSTP
mmetsp:Transcript_90151/g.291385  ORF Transcript_90151/g.291385 Transcript_90151/m.291385 type:complete len:260 (-) Transcript_90151:3461-4240(-)